MQFFIYPRPLYNLSALYIITRIWSLENRRFSMERGRLACMGFYVCNDAREPMTTTMNARDFNGNNWITACSVIYHRRIDGKLLPIPLIYKSCMGVFIYVLKCGKLSPTQHYTNPILTSSPWRRSGWVSLLCDELLCFKSRIPFWSQENQ